MRALSNSGWQDVSRDCGDDARAEPASRTPSSTACGRQHTSSERGRLLQYIPRTGPSAVGPRAAVRIMSGSVSCWFDLNGRMWVDC